MLALLLSLASGVAGVCGAVWLCGECGAWTRLAIGGAFAQLLLLYVPLYFAYSFDLGARRAGIFALCALGIVSTVGSAVAMPRLRAFATELVAKLREGRNRPLVIVALGFLSLFAWLHHTHYLRPLADGLHSGGVTWGDIGLHAGFASRFLAADGLPPLEHPLFLHGPLVYPFVPDYSVAVLAGLGLGLRWGFIFGGLSALACLVLALHAVTRAWLGGTRALEPSLVLVLFFLAGGFGFVFFFQRLFGGEALWVMLQSVNATYDISPHIAKGGHIGNLFLASRCASYGMSIGLCALLLLGRALAQPARRAPLLVAGIALGALPLVHTHSFLVCGGLMLWQLWVAQPRPAVTRAAFCLVPFALVAVPEWLFLSHGGRVSFLRFEPGFLRPAPSGLDWFLDVVLGMGLGWLLLPWAWRNASSRSRRLLWPLLALLPLANLVAFAPSAYDNVKLIAWFDLGLAILLAGWLAQKLSAAPAARAGALVAIAGCTLSGALAVGFELANDALAVPTADVALARLVTAHTPPNAVIATAATEHDPVVMLAGRRALMATPHMARLNGLPVAARATEIFRLYAGGSAASELIEAYDVFAVLIGPDERADLPRVDEAFFARHARAVYETAGRRLYVLDRQPSR